jgi:hypothetical protein
MGKFIPIFFIWNYFAIKQLTSEYCGIKWHRHDNEPVYHYDYPFGDPINELDKLRNMSLDSEVEFSILGNNFMRLQANIRK